jgi:Calreticulin family
VTCVLINFSIQIPDPTAVKPDDWDVAPQIADPASSKPENWLDDEDDMIPGNFPVCFIINLHRLQLLILFENQTQQLKSQRTGTSKLTASGKLRSSRIHSARTTAAANGSRHSLPTQNTKENGELRSWTTPTTKANGRHVAFKTQTTSKTTVRSTD